MAIYLYEKKWNEYIKSILNMYAIGTKTEHMCIDRVSGYLRCLIDNKKIDEQGYKKMLMQFMAQLQKTKQKPRKKLR